MRDRSATEEAADSCERSCRTDLFRKRTLRHKDAADCHGLPSSEPKRQLE